MSTTATVVTVPVGAALNGTGVLPTSAIGAAIAPNGAAGSGATSPEGDIAREEARLARQIRPEYPSGALAKGWEGQVLLRLRVGADGGVQTVRVERSSGHEILDRAAYRAARNWQFFPAREAGVPVEAEVKVPVVFARERD